jgi:hypothetical protein
MWILGGSGGGMPCLASAVSQGGSTKGCRSRRMGASSRQQTCLASAEVSPEALWW